MFRKVISLSELPFTKRAPPSFMGDNILFKSPMRDGAVVVENDLTHLFPYQSRTALARAATFDELDKAENNEHDSGEADDTSFENMRFGLENIRLRLESKEIQGGGFGSEATGLHPFPVARDGSTLKERDLC